MEGLEGFGGVSFRVVVSCDGDVDYTARGYVCGEEYGGEFYLVLGARISCGSKCDWSCRRAYEAFVFCEEDRYAGVDFADGERDQHCAELWIRESEVQVSAQLTCYIERAWPRLT